MNKENRTKIEQSKMEKLSHSIVSDWVESADIVLRPSDKAALKKMICQSIPEFFEKNQEFLCDRYLETVKREERRACIDAITDLDEPISGLINKQRTLNACVYS